MRIEDIFRRDINRRIEEVIKVELGDEATVAQSWRSTSLPSGSSVRCSGSSTSTATRSTSPTEETNAWVSGFFGSGKSSFAKVLSYLIENPRLAAPACDRFFSHTDAPVIKQLTTKIHDRAPTIAVLVDLLSSQNVQDEGESIVLPLYHRALLTKLGFCASIRIAEQEIKLDREKKLDAYAAKYREMFGVDWNDVHDDPLQVFEMSSVLHELEPTKFSAPDTFARGHVEQKFSAQDLAKQARELLALRGAGATRVLFVVDEAGQYVARDVKRVGDLQGVAEAFQACKGTLWIVATSQQRLEDIVESLEGNRSELARVKDRFPIKVDLLAQDIEEVVSARVLDKNSEGGSEIRAKFVATRHQLNANVKLTGSRGADLAEESVVRLYPLVPYQVQLFIDAVTARREGGMTGGSNRTLLGLTQRLVTSGEFRAGGDDVGRLVTADRAYDVLYAVIPPLVARRGHQVVKLHADKPLMAQSAQDHRPLRRRPRPTLDAHQHRRAPPRRHEQRVNRSRRAGTPGAARRGPHPTGHHRIPAAVRRRQELDHRSKRHLHAQGCRHERIRKQLLERALMGLSVTQGRTFTVALTVGDEALHQGRHTAPHS
ncbi:MAG: DUF6079 family protein [Acidimicrobiales bacterium]